MYRLRPLAGSPRPERVGQLREREDSPMRTAPLFFLPQPPKKREVVVLYRLRAALGLKFADSAVVVETERPIGVAALHAREVPDRIFAGTR
jgi:hypothetical protein